MLWVSFERLGDSWGFSGMVGDARGCLEMLVDACGCLGMLGDAWRQVIRGQVWRWWQSGGTTLSRSIRLIFPVERRNPESLPIRKWHRRISSFFCFDLSLSIPPSLPPSIHTHTHTHVYTYIFIYWFIASPEPPVVHLHIQFQRDRSRFIQDGYHDEYRHCHDDQPDSRRRIFWSIPADFFLSWAMLPGSQSRCFGMLQDSLGFFRILRDAWGFFGILVPS